MDPCHSRWTNQRRINAELERAFMAEKNSRKVNTFPGIDIGAGNFQVPTQDTSPAEIPTATTDTNYSIDHSDST